MDRAATPNALGPSVCVCVCLAGLESFSTQDLKVLPSHFVFLEGTSHNNDPKFFHIVKDHMCVAGDFNFQHNFPLSCFNFHLITDVLNLQKVQMAGAEHSCIPLFLISSI